MIIFYDVTSENKTEHNPKWPYIPDHAYRILIIGGSGSGKKDIIKFNKQSTRYWWNIFICKRPIWSKISKPIGFSLITQKR